VLFDWDDSAQSYTRIARCVSWHVSSMETIRWRTRRARVHNLTIGTNVYRRQVCTESRWDAARIGLDAQHMHASPQCCPAWHGLLAKLQKKLFAAWSPAATANAFSPTQECRLKRTFPRSRMPRRHRGEKAPSHRANTPFTFKRT